MLVTFTWLKEFVDPKLKPNELAHRLTMAGFEVESVMEAEGDVVFDVNVTPNRGDCLSVMGIAREVAAITGAELKGGRYEKRVVRTNAGDKIKSLISVEINDKKKCLRYAARAVCGVQVRPSPDWLGKRLLACGIRPINNVVDATNYMMIETGQPFHAFDHRELRGRNIRVSVPNGATDFITLDEISRKLSSDDLLISDAERPVAIAGVMGGLYSGIKDDTTTVVLESACFDPVSVRRTSKRLGLVSESSRRFERGVDPNTTVLFMNRLVALIIEIAGGMPTADWVDIYPKKVTPTKVPFSLSDANKLLGTDIKQEFIKKCFNSLGIGISANVCMVPSYRSDITRFADLVEEVARLYGYDKIPITLPQMEMSSIAEPAGYGLTNKVRDFMQAKGFFEAVNYGFTSPTEVGTFYNGEPIRIENPLGVEFSAMKTTLLGGLMNNVKLNVDLGQDTVRLFEIRPVFVPHGSGKATEKKKFSAVIYGRRSPMRWTARDEDSDFFDIKGVVEAIMSYLGLEDVVFAEGCGEAFMHPQASCIVSAHGRNLGYAGHLHPSVAAKWDMPGPVTVFNLDWDSLVQTVLSTEKKSSSLDKFPNVRRDMALLVPSDITNARVVSTVKDYGSAILKSLLPFDLYKGKGIPEGKKSVAYAVWYCSPERTLTDKEVNETHAGLVAFLKDKLGAEIR